MEHKDVIQRGNSLEVKFVVTNKTLWSINNSPKFVISGNAVFQVRVITSRITSQTTYYINLVFIRFCKQRRNETMNYNIKFTCNEFAMKDKCFTTDDGTWRLVHHSRSQEDTYMFTVFVVMDVVPHAISLAPLHEDDELTDFELRGEDGAIRVHRAVLAAASPVLKRMLCGPWSEATEGYVDLSGITKATLQHLKNYIYMSTLPDVGLQQLLLLASYYMMPDLEQKCVVKLLQSLKAQNAYELLEFAMKNNVTRLSLAILDSVQNHEVKVEEIRSLVYSGSSRKNSFSVATSSDDKK